MEIEQKKLELNKESLSYVQEVLKSGNDLSVQILNEIDLDKGRLFTFLPGYIPQERLHDFETGVVTYYRPQSFSSKLGQSTANYTYDFIEEYIQDSGGIFIIEDRMSSVEDEFIIENKESGEMLVYNDNIYYMLREHNVDKIRWSFQYAESAWAYITAALSHVSGSLLADAELTAESLGKIVKYLDYVIVGAYDGEGYIIWESEEN